MRLYPLNVERSTVSRLCFCNYTCKETRRGELQCFNDLQDQRVEIFVGNEDVDERTRLACENMMSWQSTRKLRGCPNLTLALP
jgi:hypothetical protein